MQGWRRHRRWLSGWLVAVMLFAQMATAAHACPLAQTAVPMADMPGCTGHGGMDAAQPQLCKAHCESGLQSVNSHAASPDAPPAAIVDAAWVGVLDVAATATRAAAMPAAVAVGPPAGAPPLYIALLVLRN